MSPSVTAFGAALRKGSGRAMLLLRQEPDSPALRTELMRACKANLHYDEQVEHYRASYLHRLIRTRGQERYFGRELSCWLARAGPSDESIGTAQAFHVLCLLAEDDTSFDRTVLHDFIRRATYDMTDVGSTAAFIRLQGMEAFLLYVRRFADSIADEEEASSFKYLVEALGERDGVEVAASSLEAARATCPELDRLMALDPDAAFAEKHMEAMDYAAAKEALVANGRIFPQAWVRQASSEEFAQAARDLLAERDVRKLLAYLGLFRRREFPAPATSLFPLLRHEDDVVADGTAKILGRIGGCEVRRLALEFLAGERPWIGLRMLRSDLHLGDFRHVTQRMDGLTLDADGWHYAGFAIFDLLEDAEAPTEEGRALLMRLYEEEPCSFCRYTVVSRLVASGDLPGWMAEECRYDAEPETVDLVSPVSGAA